MTAIFQEITVGWKGEEHRIKPTMELINRIEGKVSLATLAAQLAEGDVRLSHVATAVAVMLQTAGVKVTGEDVYAEMIHGDPGAISNMAQAVVVAAFPARPNAGNVASPKTTRRRKA
ncbi:GTA-gp10 family protein [Bordetella genomosp. 7]|uniref:Phage tail protein n=1 Tax=Bordetella genomosp. 7 TaxID=1416805 RepID=A0A261RRE2_9BORD|nr:GTA-gp10 family protein [Bordetella genomosp. 7]OZI27525.1 hypothetical protein CAL19_02015 [Bordetella genomosp. 7]